MANSEFWSEVTGVGRLAGRKKSVSLSVTEWAQPVPGKGHIESSSGFGELPQWGQMIHQDLQASFEVDDPNFQAEVPIHFELKHESWKIKIRGKMDGLYAGNRPPLIEEIKSSFHMDRLRQRLQEFPDHPYILQLQSYGYFYWKKYSLAPELQLRLVNSRTREAEILPVELDVGMYEAWLQLRAAELVRFEEVKLAHEERRRELAKKLVFPFRHPREKQDELMKRVEAAKAPLVLQAPTGMGKTLGVLFPMLKEAFTRGQTCIYVTPKNSQHSVVQQSLEMIRTKGVDLRYVILTAKHKLCRKPEPMCGPEYCEYSKDYYSKMHQSQVTDRVGQAHSLAFDEMLAFSDAHQVCPFELSLDSLYQFDVIVCDYNYVFSPHNILGRISQRPLPKTQRPNLIVDEAHHLPDRARSYFSPDLDCHTLVEAANRFRELPKSIGKKAGSWVEQAIKLIQSYKSSVTTEVSLMIEPEAFEELAEALSFLVTDYLEQNSELLPDDPILKLYSYWGDFVGLIGSRSDSIIVSFVPNRWGGRLQMTCCDASDHLAEIYPFFRKLVFFSATMKPFDYYVKLSGLTSVQAPEMAEFTSPFPREKRKVLIIPQISTKLRDRERHLPRFVDAIDRIAQLQPGNYFLFFPSFQFLDLVFEAWNRPGFELIKQTQGMRAKEVQRLLSSLQDEPKNKLIFAVQGGQLSEGVDYPEGTAVGAFIIGPGLPAFTKERELLKQYYDRHYGDGYNYAYTYPAMTKVIQSAGRVIRSEKDKGLIVLMDQRFVVPKYVEAMPEDWVEEGLHRLSSPHILRDIQQFWNP